MLPPDQVQEESCFETFLKPQKPSFSVADVPPATFNGKGGKGKPALQFADPEVSAPKELEFYGIATQEMNDAMTTDYNHRTLLLKVIHHIYTYGTLYPLFSLNSLCKCSIYSFPHRSCRNSTQIRSKNGLNKFLLRCT